MALTIKSITIHDRGVYTCVARNALGEASTQAQLTVVTKKDVLLESQHPQGLEKIRYLEDDSRYARSVKEETTIQIKPRFLGPLKGTNKIVEGQRAHFEIRLEPMNDPNMKVEWYFNQKIIMQVLDHSCRSRREYSALFCRPVASICSTTLVTWPWMFWMSAPKMPVLTLW